MWPAIIAAGASLLGSLIGSSNQKDAAESAAQAQYDAKMAEIEAQKKNRFNRQFTAPQPTPTTIPQSPASMASGMDMSPIRLEAIDRLKV